MNEIKKVVVKIEEPFKEGERVLLVGEVAQYGSIRYLNFFKENKIWGLTLGAVDRMKYHVSSDYVLVGYENSYPTLGKEYKIGMFRQKSVSVIPKEQYTESDQWLKDADAKIEAHKKIVPLRCMTESTVSYMDRTFSFKSAQDIETNHSYIILGNWYKEKNAFTNVSCHYRPSCCALTKTNLDLRVWIPKVWMNYFGYTNYDLVEWLKFLSKCGIGFESEYRGEEPLDVYFKESPSNEWDSTELQQEIIVGENCSCVFQKGNKGFLALQMKGAPENMLTYMRFIAVRYMYNMKYWTIPGHAMQIKRALGSLVTHWEALLLAHLGVDYYNYYCFVDQRSFNKEKPHYYNPVYPLAGDSNYDRHVDPYQTVESVLVNVKAGNRPMNQSFTYMNDTFKRAELDEFFTKKDWKGLYMYTKEKTNAKKEKK